MCFLGYQGYSGGQYPSGYQGMHSYNQGAYPPSSGYPPDSRGYQGSAPPNHQSNYQGYQQNYQRPGYPPGPPGPNQPPGYQQDQFSVSIFLKNNVSNILFDIFFVPLSFANISLLTIRYF